MGKGLSPDQIMRRVREAAEPVAASFGLAIWGIEMVLKFPLNKPSYF